MKNLDDTSLNEVEISESRKIFKFGDSRKVIVTSNTKLPAQIGNTKCFVKEIVQEKIPLLLSKTTLKKAGAVLNLQNDNIKMFDEDMEVTASSNGHYAINILPDETCNFDNIEQVLIFEEDESGFSPHQIVLGRNINLPLIYNDRPAADLPQSKIIIEHLSVLHATRQAFIASKSSKKLKTALQKKTRQTREHFDHGSQVYYKQNTGQKWKGSGKVVGHDGTVIFIRRRDFSSKLIVHMYC